MCIMLLHRRVYQSLKKITGATDLAQRIALGYDPVVSSKYM